MVHQRDDARWLSDNDDDEDNDDYDTIRYGRLTCAQKLMRCAV